MDEKTLFIVVMIDEMITNLQFECCYIPGFLASIGGDYISAEYGSILPHTVIKVYSVSLTMMSEIVKDFIVSPLENQSMYFMSISPQIQESTRLGHHDVAEFWNDLWPT